MWQPGGATDQLTTWRRLEWTSRGRGHYVAAWRCYGPVDHMEEAGVDIVRERTLCSSMEVLRITVDHTEEAGVDTLKERKLRGSLEELSTTVDHIEEVGLNGHLEGEETVRGSMEVLRTS